MDKITIYNALEITSTMSGLTNLILAESMEKLGALRDLLSKIALIDDGGETLDAFTDFLMADPSLVYVNALHFTNDYDLAGTELTVVADDYGNAYIVNEFIRYSERF